MTLILAKWTTDHSALFRTPGCCQILSLKSRYRGLRLPLQNVTARIWRLVKTCLTSSLTWHQRHTIPQTPTATLCYGLMLSASIKMISLRGHNRSHLCSKYIQSISCNCVARQGRQAFSCCNTIDNGVGRSFKLDWISGEATDSG